MDDSTTTDTKIDQNTSTIDTSTENDSKNSTNQNSDNQSQQQNQQETGEIQEISTNITDNLLPKEENQQSDENNQNNQEDSNNSNENNQQEDQTNNSEQDNNSTEIDQPADDQNQDNENDSKEQLFAVSSTYSDEVIQSAYDQMMDFDEMPESSMFTPVLQKAYREKLAAINSQDYDKAKRIEEIINAISRENNSVAFQTPYNSESRYLNEREVRLQQKFQDTKVKYKGKLDKHKEDSEYRLRQLKAKHQREIDDLRIKYQDPQFLRTFNRPSRQLITMRKAERRLALAKHYEEARKVKILADREQQMQERKMQETAKQSMESEYIKLIDRQQKETEKMMEFDKKMESEIESAKHKELSPIRAAMKQTEVRRANSEQSRQIFHSSSATDSKQRFSSSVLAAKQYNPMLAKDISSKGQGLPSPRTMQKMKMMREKHKAEINIDPIQNSTFDKLEKISQRKYHTMLPKL